MKRISFFVIILCAFLLAGLTANAQGLISIAKVGGQFRNDTVKAGQNVRFLLKFNNTNAEKCNISNGFELYSPEGGTWDSTTIDTLGYSVSGLSVFAGYFDVAFADSMASGDGAGRDTAFVLGAGAPSKLAKQMPAGFNDTALAITAWFSNKADSNMHICIDTAFFQPGGTWVWVGKSLAEYFPTFDGAPGLPGNDGFCFFIYDVPDLPAMVLNTGAACETPFVDPNLSASHCAAQTYDFDACDPDHNGSPETITLVSGPGAVAGGVWSANTLPVGVHTVTVNAGGGDPVNMTVTATNAAPVISGGCGTLTITNTGAVKTVQMAGTDADACDPKNWSISGIVPATGATATIDGTGKVTFSATDAGTFTVTVCLSDGIAAQPTCCEIVFNVAAGSLYGVRIEKTHATLQGQFEKVDVILESINGDPVLGGLGGFDILIGYDNSALSLQSVDIATSGLYTTCKWEYFTYRFGANGNCSGGCPSGLVRVVGIAETNNGAAHPTCDPKYVPTLPTVMFSMNFLVSNDRTLECQYVPIRFFWIDCGDNTLSSWDGGQLYIAGRVFDYHNQDVQIDPLLASFPGFAGVPAGFCTNPDPNKPAPDRNIDFFDGGIDIVCADSIDARGDVNLNNVTYEIADAVMFTNYFVKGLSAFGTHVQGSIAATDVNADGLALSVADLVYLIRVIVGDALPYPKTAPVQATYVNDNGTLSVDMPMGAAYVVIKGEVAPELLAQNMEMSYGVREGNTHVIVYPSFNASATASFEGNFLNANGAIISVEMATADGAPVVAKMVPANFGLAQNYPNPFNPTANISFSLPVASQYTLTVYNVTGQKVSEFSGTKEAGNHTITFNGENMASGVYFYKLIAGDFSATKKMVLLK